MPGRKAVFVISHVFPLKSSRTLTNHKIHCTLSLSSEIPLHTLFPLSLSLALFFLLVGRISWLWNGTNPEAVCKTCQMIVSLRKIKSSMTRFILFFFLFCRFLRGCFAIALCCVWHCKSSPTPSDSIQCQVYMASVVLRDPKTTNGKKENEYECECWCMQVIRLTMFFLFHKFQCVAVFHLLQSFNLMSFEALRQTNMRYLHKTLVSHL